jgi:hypothetical protein
VFNDAVSGVDHIAPNVRWIVNNEFERIWNEAVVPSVEVLFPHLPGGTEENIKYIRILCIPGRDSNRVPSE